MTTDGWVDRLQACLKDFLGWTAFVQPGVGVWGAMNEKGGIKNEDRRRRNDSRGGCRLSAAAGPLLPTQPPPIAGRPSGGDRFIRLNPTESDRSIFQSQSKDMNLTPNGKTGLVPGNGGNELGSG